VPTAGATPAASAAFSLLCPSAIAFQNGHRCALSSTGGLPGDRSLGRSDRFDFNVFCFINTSVLDVLRRRVEFTTFASQVMTAKLAVCGMTASMTRKGECWDNAPTESFLNSLKNERLHGTTYPTRDDAQADLFEYIEAFYNRSRRHSALGYNSPAQFLQNWISEHVDHQSKAA